MLKRQAAPWLGGNPVATKPGISAQNDRVADNLQATSVANGMDAIGTTIAAERLGHLVCLFAAGQLIMDAAGASEASIRQRWALKAFHVSHPPSLSSFPIRRARYQVRPERRVDRLNVFYRHTHIYIYQSIQQRRSAANRSNVHLNTPNFQMQTVAPTLEQQTYHCDTSAPLTHRKGTMRETSMVVEAVTSTIRLSRQTNLKEELHSYPSTNGFQQ